MENPYKPHPETLRKRRVEIQEEQMIALVPEASRPSPSINRSDLPGILFGPLANQPSQTFPAPNQISLGGLLIIQFPILVLTLIFNGLLFIASLIAFNRSIPLPACLINLIMFPLSAFAFLSYFKKEAKSKSAIQVYYLAYSIYFFILACTAASGISNRPFIREEMAFFYIAISLISAISFLYFLNSKRVRITYSFPEHSSQSPSA